METIIELVGSTASEKNFASCAEDEAHEANCREKKRVHVQAFWNKPVANQDGIRRILVLTHAGRRDFNFNNAEGLANTWGELSTWLITRSKMSPSRHARRRRPLRVLLARARMSILVNFLPFALRAVMACWACGSTTMHEPWTPFCLLQRSSTHHLERNQYSTKC